jgi:hypothetical protein
MTVRPTDAHKISSRSKTLFSSCCVFVHISSFQVWLQGSSATALVFIIQAQHANDFLFLASFGYFFVAFFVRDPLVRGRQNRPKSM